MSEDLKLIWNPDSFIAKTDELEEIIFDNTSLSILAGPGSGKTEMLAQKSIFLIQNNLCPWPKKILFLTFKNEASKNIHDRIIKREPSAKDRFTSRTYHSFAKTIVDNYRLALDEKIRPNIGYDIIYKGKSNKEKVHINDIISYALIILENNEKIRLLFKETYSHIFLDEFQDTTIKQYELISCIFLNSSSKVICVGDLNQSIMLFADADPDIYKRIEKDFSPTRKLLVSNFRASDNIKKFLAPFMKYVENGAIPLLTKENNDSCSLHHFQNDIQEANFLSNFIEQKISNGIYPAEICVLTKQKSNEYALRLSEMLTRKNIQNIIHDGFQDALSEPLGIIFSHILECLMVRSPKSWSEFISIYQEIHSIDLTITHEQSKLQDFINYFSEEKKNVDLNNVDDIIKFINKTIKKIGVTKIKARWSQYKSKENINNNWHILANRLKSIFHIAKDKQDIVNLFTGTNAVKIMNIHKCKGLEYKIVILLGFEDEGFWNYSDNSFEQRCILYVAFTRAKDEIIISQSDRRYFINGGKKELKKEKIAHVYQYLTKTCGMVVIQH
ncbi:hypothetical protein BJK05_18840 [Pectobacterium polaris]|nr:hypothetical protein BJK05_18840 [Pectobacterium polaris]